MSGKHHVETTKLALGIDREVAALLQAHGCLLEESNTCLWLTYPAGTTYEELYPRVHTTRYLVTLPDGYCLEVQTLVGSDCSIVYYQPPETEQRRPFHLEACFLYAPQQPVRLLAGPLKGLIFHVEARRPAGGSHEGPRYLICGFWYHEHELAPVDGAASGQAEDGQ